MCGDLYPEEPERKIILGSIQAYCGPPTATKKLNLPTGDIAYFNNWRSSDKVKHKGCAVGDLEKARLDPLSWGVSGLANHSGERPARPVRVPPTLVTPQSKVQAQDAPSQAIVPAGTVVAGDSEPPGGKGPGGKGPGKKTEAQTAKVGVIATHPIATHPRATHPIAAHPIATHPIATHPIATHSITIFSAASCWQVPIATSSGCLAASNHITGHVTEHVTEHVTDLGRV